jgi:hypothetical protein
MIKNIITTTTIISLVATATISVASILNLINLEPVLALSMFAFAAAGEILRNQALEADISQFSVRNLAKVAQLNPNTNPQNIKEAA